MHAIIVVNYVVTFNLVTLAQLMRIDWVNLHHFAFVKMDDMILVNMYAKNVITNVKSVLIQLLHAYPVLIILSENIIMTKKHVNVWLDILIFQTNQTVANLPVSNVEKVIYVRNVLKIQIEFYKEMAYANVLITILV